MEDETEVAFLEVEGWAWLNEIGLEFIELTPEAMAEAGLEHEIVTLRFTNDSRETVTLLGLNQILGLVIP
jgi:hypothetical protein